MTTEEIKAAMAKKTHRAHPEADLQEAVFEYINAQYPKVLAFAIPNAAKRGKYARKEAKKTGLLSGVPDLFVGKPKFTNIPTGAGCEIKTITSYGLFIELKNGKRGKVSDNQENIQGRLINEGYQTHVCRSFDEAKQVIDNYLKQ